MRAHDTAMPSHELADGRQANPESVGHAGLRPVLLTERVEDIGQKARADSPSLVAHHESDGTLFQRESRFYGASAFAELDGVRDQVAEDPREVLCIAGDEDRGGGPVRV